MKITRNIPDHLIIENNPLPLAIIVILFALTFVSVGVVIVAAGAWMGSVFIFAGLFFGVVFTIVFVRRVQLVLDRPNNRIELRKRTLLGYSAQTWPLDRLDHAIVETMDNSGRRKRRRSGRNRRYGAAKTHRAVMVFPQATHPVTSVYSSGPSAANTAEAINSWLKSTSP
ncbi:hypothetical protein ABMC88_02775 [Sulfitobacter sp. HNIBRBA2951]|uniref:hypothetical protein n=1 Tax=Sulfitobacter aquimarinus TaxID=3158557 RepID=UPI0032DFCD3B